MNRLLDIMRRLRAPDGCPWDREQTHESLRPYLLEEAAEAVDAISLGDDHELVGELGDVLLQVAFHATIAEGAGSWTYADVESSIVEKLVRRHPHVFGEVSVEDADEVVRNWQAIKAREGGAVKRGNARVPSELGALARETKAQKILRREKRGREAILTALEGAGNNADGVANVLAAVVAWARAVDVDAEVALRAHTARALEADDAPERT